jgi:hypothetical protein
MSVLILKVKIKYIGKLLGNNLSICEYGEEAVAYFNLRFKRESMNLNKIFMFDMGRILWVS